MTTGSDMQSPSPQMHAPPPPRKARNTVGLIALITAIIGAVFAVIPGALIIGWILLPVAFILSIVSLFLKDQKRGHGIAGLIISIVGTLIGFIVFFAVVGTAVDDAFNDDVEIQSPADGGEVEEDVVDDDAAGEETGTAADGEEGTRDNPLALGSTISASDWEVTVNSVDLNATEAVLAENPLNETPDAENTYIMANITATYIGDSPDGDTPWVDVEFVSATGNSYDGTMSMIVVPEGFNSSDTLYEGASTTGNFGIEVPTEALEEGTLRVAPTMFGDGVFFEVQ